MLVTGHNASSIGDDSTVAHLRAIENEFGNAFARIVFFNEDDFKKL